MQGDEDSLIEVAGNDFDVCACELGTDLVKATSRDALFRTINIVCGYWRVVGRLLGEI